MVTDTPAPPAPRPITMEDVQRMLGAMTLEIEMLRRENASLREALTQSNNGDPA